MTRIELPVLPLIAFAALLWLQPGHFSEGIAMEQGPGNSDARTAVEDDRKLDPATARGVPSSRLEAQEEYRRQLQAYEKAMNETRSDEERDQLRHRFLEQTREYRAFLAGQELADRSRERAEEIRALQKGFDSDRRQMKRDHDRGLRAIDKEQNELLSGVHENWPARVETLEQKKRRMNEDYQKRLRLLEERYSTRLQKLD